MVEIKYKGRLGNNLFQYCVARILSEKLNDGIVSKQPDFTFSEYENPAVKKYETGCRVCCNKSHSKYYYMKFLNEMRNKLRNKNLCIDGYFQDIEFIRQCENKILSIFNVDDEPIPGILIHSRLTDEHEPNNEHELIENINNIPCIVKCVEKILHKNPKLKIYITTNVSESPYIAKLVESFDSAEVVQKTPKETILWGCRFDHKILSSGSFSWWIGFLGNQNNVNYLGLEGNSGYHKIYQWTDKWHDLGCL